MDDDRHYDDAPTHAAHASDSAPSNDAPITHVAPPITIIDSSSVSRDERSASTSNALAQIGLTENDLVHRLADIALSGKRTKRISKRDSEGDIVLDTVIEEEDPAIAMKAIEMLQALLYPDKKVRLIVD